MVQPAFYLHDFLLGRHVEDFHRTCARQLGYFGVACVGVAEDGLYLGGIVRGGRCHLGRHFRVKRGVTRLARHVDIVHINGAGITAVVDKGYFLDLREVGGVHRIGEVGQVEHHAVPSFRQFLGREEHVGCVGSKLHLAVERSLHHVNIHMQGAISADIDCFVEIDVHPAVQGVFNANHLPAFHVLHAAYLGGGVVEYVLYAIGHAVMAAVQGQHLVRRLGRSFGKLRGRVSHFGTYAAQPRKQEQSCPNFG